MRSILILGAYAVAIGSLLPMTQPVLAAKVVPTERIMVPSKDGDGVDLQSVDNPAPVGAETESDADPAADAEAATRQKAPIDPADLPRIYYGTGELPPAVQRTYHTIMEAAASGDIETMRVVLEMNEVMPTLSFGEIGDPIEFLKESSGDAEGREILAILMEVLEAGWVHVDTGTPQEMYIWPYFARIPLEALTPEQTVELFKIITAGDLEDMRVFGAYVFYRVGIGPDGTLHYFVTGD